MKLYDVVRFEIGTPLSRVNEHPCSPGYNLYDQVALQADFETRLESKAGKQICTPDLLPLLKENDIIFSLISGTAVQICESRAGYVFSHNFVRLRPQNGLDADFLVYLLNEDEGIKRQLVMFLQGSTVKKYSVAQLRALELGQLPPLEIQRRIGRVYQRERRLQMLKKRLASNETALRNHYLAQVLKKGTR